MTKNNAQSERHAGAASPWLFPGESDGHKTKTTLSGQIIDRITKEIGIRVTPHQFRHLAAAFKAGRLHLAVLPDWSASRIDRYVEHYRLFFRNAESTNRLWLSQLGRPLAYCSLYGLICKRTRDAFGKRINPHPFRSCLATSTAIYHGAEIGLAMTVLEHTISEVFERYYNQAKMIDAVKAYQEILLANPQG